MEKIQQKNLNPVLVQKIYGRYLENIFGDWENIKINYTGGKFTIV